MQVNILLFAAAAQPVGQRQVSIVVDNGSTLGQVAERLGNQYPELSAMIPVSRWSIDHEFALLSTVIVPSQEIALIPPVSGG